MASDLAREELEPCPFCGDKHPHLEEVRAHSHGPIASFMPDHPGSAFVSCTNCEAMMTEVSEAAVVAAWNRRARTAYDAIGAGVKTLGWIDSGAGNHSSAHSELGVYVVSQTRTGEFRVFVQWIDPGGNDCDHEICRTGSFPEAKAAAQADFERRVLSCLSTHTAAGAGPVEEADAKAGGQSEFNVLWPALRGRLDRGEIVALARKLAPPASTIPSEPEAKGEAGAGPVGEAVALRERVARALNSALGSEEDENPRHHPAQNSWETPSEVWWTQWLEAADAVVAALYARTVEEPGAVERLVEETGSSSVDDLRDMALVGHSLMEVIGIATADGPYKDWAPAENPTEIVIDLINDLEEAQANVVRLTLAAEDNQQAAKEAEEARDEAMRGERAAEAALAETRGLIRDAIGLVPLAHQNWHTDARAALSTQESSAEEAGR